MPDKTHAPTALFDDFFQNAPPILDLPAIRSQWLALGSGYDVNKWRLPVPVWAQRPFEDNGSQAWEIVKNELVAEDPYRGLVIYLHVPFCTSKCGFCDSYSFKLGNHREERMDEYVERLCYEIHLWSQQGNLCLRPVSTVHLGGGTPAFLGEKRMAKLACTIRNHFAIASSTEWALESTVESLGPSMISTLHNLGFRRLHIGVQSMEENVRGEIGRRCSREEVMNAVERTLRQGWVVTVDLLCGLPFQTLEGYLSGIQDLLGAGVDGFSIYELLIYPQNFKWAEKHGLTQRSHLANFWMFLAGACLLETCGFKKNLFNHWANQRDRNLYFTFPTRGEDCLALGAIADGVFGSYHYRHPRYAPYIKTSVEGLPGLEGGLRRNDLEERLQPITTAILSGQIPEDLLASLETGPSWKRESLLDHWVKSSLVTRAASGIALTANGSWFTGNLIQEVKAFFQGKPIAYG